jgi:hypothetical protein
MLASDLYDELDLRSEVGVASHTAALQVNGMGLKRAAHRKEPRWLRGTSARRTTRWSWTR